LPKTISLNKQKTRASTTVAAKTRPSLLPTLFLHWQMLAWPDPFPYYHS
jgi:hypothetical protein